MLTYTGRLVSDFFASYKDLDCLHQFCMAHICRELVGVYEKTKQSWALELKEHLEWCNKGCHAARERLVARRDVPRGSAKVWIARVLAFEYDEFVKAGIRANPLAPAVWNVKKGKAVAAALSPARALYRETSRPP
ncbi:transposase [Armatimonas sp.]|uniref:IS66 family transposase n=1 Tax=Armatimonas sp. TaxID=1872638 RepID=UPI00374CC86F